MTDPLTLSVVTILGKYAVDAGVTLAKEAGPAAAKKAGQLLKAALDYLRQKPEGQVIAASFEAKPDVYAKPLEDQLQTAVQADPAFRDQLAALLAEYQAQAAAPQATLTGSGAVAQGEGATAVGERGSYVGRDAGLIITGDHNVIQVGPQTTAPAGEPVDLEWADPVSGRPLQAQVDLVALRDKLVQHFSLAELDDLCFKVGVDEEEIPGRTRPEKAREMVQYFRRRNRLPELLAACRAERPTIQWLDG
jgi:hypothetical protein